jgi:predicted ATPase
MSKGIMQPDAITHVTIRGFKSIAAVERLELRPVNVLIGANGSGKSNFIASFAFFDLISRDRERLPNYVNVAGGAEKILHFGSKTSKEMYLHLDYEGGGHFEATFAPTADDGLYLSHFDGERTNLKPRSNSGRWRVYHFHDTSASSPMRKTAKLDDNRFLRPDGSNLAAFLYYLRARHEGAYSLIRRIVQRVAPFFEDFHLEPRELAPDNIKLEWLHKRSDQYWDASSLSDGTLRFIALTTLFFQPIELRPSLILVDEPELGLHPYAIEMLAALIRQASVDTQVIVSTQSPILLDHFEPKDVLVADRVRGATQIRHLDPERLAVWLEDYSLGQLWEKNEFEGQPVPE